LKQFLIRRNMSPEERIRQWVQFLYPQQADLVFRRLQALLADFVDYHPDLSREAATRQLTQRDVILITYGDLFQAAGQSPLHTLGRFLDANLRDCISGVHILPFFPYSSDDGFSVIDFRQVDPALGSWADITQLGRSYRLMVDAVVNHISRESAWFQRFLAGDPQAQADFIVISPEVDLSQVVRPRTLPLLAPVETSRGVMHVWTTFSSDQIDLNYANPDVLLEIVDLLLFYVARGASIIRLDAIAYLWKEPGTSCIHLPQTHAVVKLFRAVLDAAAPGVLLIAETNVPHAENISYFGKLLPENTGTDEAQMVYAFPLAPLVLHTFHTGNARALAGWVSSLSPLPAGATFFNFLASHDGIGVRPAEGLITSAQIHALVEKTLAHGGKVSYKTDPDGTQSPYELNITWYDALNDPSHPDPDMDIHRFLASQAIMLSLAGVPGIYAHSLFGSRNCYECFEATGRARSLNREKFQLHQLEERLEDMHSYQSQVFSGYRRMLQVRKEQAAFHPQGGQRVLPVEEGIFAVLRTSPDQSESVVCLIEATGRPQAVQIDLAAQRLPGGEWVELLSGQPVSSNGGTLIFALPSYGYGWLKLRR
jgi:sucrose phosphorylase